jgi:tetratricopeptide (TPR) repeat protein
MNERRLQNPLWHGRPAHESRARCPCHFGWQGFCMSLNVLRAGIVLGGMLLGAIAEANGQTASSTTETLQSHADRLQAQFKDAEALPLYREIQKQNPKAYEPLLKLCRCLNNVGEEAEARGEPFFAEAVTLGRALCEQFPDRKEGHFELAAAVGNLSGFKGGNEKVKMAKEIADHAQRAVDLDPAWSYGYTVLGVYHREAASVNGFLKFLADQFLDGAPQGSFAESETCLLKAVELDPGAIYPRYQLGLTLVARKKKDEALAQFRTVVSLPVKDHQDARNQKLAQKQIQDLAK